MKNKYSAAKKAVRHEIRMPEGKSDFFKPRDDSYFPRIPQKEDETGKLPFVVDWQMQSK